MNIPADTAGDEAIQGTEGCGDHAEGPGGERRQRSRERLWHLPRCFPGICPLRCLTQERHLPPQPFPRPGRDPGSRPSLLDTRGGVFLAPLPARQPRAGLCQAAGEVGGCQTLRWEAASMEIVEWFSLEGN